MKLIEKFSNKADSTIPFNNTYIYFWLSIMDRKYFFSNHVILMEMFDADSRIIVDSQIFIRYFPDPGCS